MPGVILTNWVSIAAELQKDWRLDTVPKMAQLFNEHLHYDSKLMRNLAAASRAQ